MALLCWARGHHDSREPGCLGWRQKSGQLIQEDHSYSFQYQNINSLDPHRDLVSLTMPVRAKQYETQVLMPPFQMALPEGALLETLRTRFGKVMNINNDIVLLKLIGSHTIGRVRFTESGMPLDTGIQSNYSLSDLITYSEIGRKGLPRPGG